MKPTYQVRVWPEDDWWLARVVAATDGADSAPLNAITQARSLTKIESMGRDLISTILDADEDAFDVDLDYILPADVGDLVCQAKCARAWLDAAQEFWQDRSTVAVHALAEKGYSLRETATLLGLSHQRVDQLLGSHAEREMRKSFASLVRSFPAGEHSYDVDALLVLRNQTAHDHRSDSRYEDLAPQFEERLRALLTELVLRVRQDSGAIERECLDAE